MGRFFHPLTFKVMLVASVIYSATWAPVKGQDTPPVRLHTSAVIVRILNKITAHVTEIEVPVDQRISFESLDLTIKHCAKNPPEDPPESVAFITIEERKEGGAPAPVFSGWMFSSAPAVSAMEHPVYDVWTVACVGPSRLGMDHHNVPNPIPSLTDGDGVPTRKNGTLSSGTDIGTDTTTPSIPHQMPNTSMDGAENALDGFLEGLSERPRDGQADKAE